MAYTGLVQQTERFAEAAEGDEPTEWDDQYMRLSIRFETAAQRYGWLNTSLFVARGRLLGTGISSTRFLASADPGAISH